jgi:hypothetical protein
VFAATLHAESAARFLKLRRNPGIIGLELNKSASKTLSKHAIRRTHCRKAAFGKLTGNIGYIKGDYL